MLRRIASVLGRQPPGKITSLMKSRLAFARSKRWSGTTIAWSTATPPPVELPAQVGVVLVQDAHPPVEAGLAHALAGERELPVGDRRRGHPAAVLAGSVEREAAPPAADLEQVVAGPEPQLLAEALELRLLGLGERHPRVGEQGRGVHPRRVEEQR
ncbi:MAG: hypothetical protein MUC84_06580, partial [Solirubrobacteraceae bacterium]|nr:hypothetical protein [Solirubrobacteraceae bacterium]